MARGKLFIMAKTENLRGACSQFKVSYSELCIGFSMSIAL